MAITRSALDRTARRYRRPIVVSAITLGALSLVTAGIGLSSASAVSEGAGAGTSATGSTALVECRSGVVTDGDIQTSSLSVTVVDAGHVPELPEGCRITP